MEDLMVPASAVFTGSTFTAAASAPPGTDRSRPFHRRPVANKNQKRQTVRCFTSPFKGTIYIHRDYILSFKGSIKEYNGFVFFIISFVLNCRP